MLRRVPVSIPPQLSRYVAMLVCCVPIMLVHAQPAATATHRAESGVDSDVHPGDDFFAWANGEWLQGTAIPSGKDRWHARGEIEQLTAQQIGKLIDDSAAATPGSDARKVADFRAAYLNSSAIEAHGPASLAAMLNRIDAMRDRTALASLLGSELPADVDPMNWGVYDSSHLFGLAVERGPDEANTIAFLLQGGLGLTNAADYFSAADGMQSVRDRYREYCSRMLALAGFDRAMQRAERVLALEIAIARTHATPAASADLTNISNLWARADFERRAPGMNWNSFFAAAGLSQQDQFVVWQPEAVKGTAALVGSQPLDVWLDYLRFRFIDRYADVLPKAFAEEALAFRSESSAQPAPRTQRAMQATQGAMSGALARMYAERHFPPALKARAQTIATNVVAAFRERVEAAAWMSAQSRKTALAKLQALNFDVGYPPRWPDYSALTIDAMDAVGNTRRVAQWNYRQTLTRLGEPLDMQRWLIESHKVGAVLIFEQNAYNFPAALLQAPKFDPTASDAANYGAFGAIVGHETSHFVDTLGADYDSTGRKARWWTAEDLANFNAAAEPLVHQYSSYHVLPDATVDGKLTLVENIADLGGLEAAFEAYRRTLGGRIDDKDYVRQQDRQFFIGYARSWRGKTREAAMRRLLVTDSHAPENLRIATVRNVDAWYEAFDVRPGHRLYLEPRARVRIW